MTRAIFGGVRMLVVAAGGQGGSEQRPTRQMNLRLLPTSDIVHRRTII